MPIYSYRVNEPYGEFSNFSKHPFEADGKKWPTSEHCFQAQKFAGTIHQERARLAASAKEAARIGRDRSLPMRPVWEDVKLEVMRSPLRHKFNAHSTLVQLLLSTADEEIIGQTTDDIHWGCGTNRDGLNMLGRLLMELRAAYRKATKFASTYVSGEPTH
jgi:N-glycosidase YbiA